MIKTLGITELTILLVCVLVPVLAMVDLMKNKYHGNNKTIWILLVIFTNIIGSLLYFIIGRQQKRYN
ncbi:MAG: PLD nuclease N-terminal domain-containing protein [Paludibacter sp.]|jgi:FtsH-binding integral membrane protein